MREEKPPLKEHLKTLHQDAVLWKAERLWTTAGDPDSHATAIEAITAMLMAMRNEAKRTSYITAIADDMTGKARERNRKLAGLEKTIEEAEKKAKKFQLKKTRTPNEEATLQDLLQTIEEAQPQLKELRTRPLAELPEATLKKAVREAARKRKTEQENARMQAKFEQKVQNASDAGLPEDWQGSREDIFDALKYGIYVHEDVYYSRGGTKGDYPISNFTMKILYHVKTSDENAYRLIALKNVYGIEATINMNTDDFVSLGSFKKVIARYGDYVFKGVESDLSRLQELLQKDEVSTRNINILGWQRQSSFWAWGNGITTCGADDELCLRTDTHGMVEHGSRRYLISACAAMYEDKDEEFVTEKKFIFCQPNHQFGFGEWCGLMQKVYKKRTLPGILFYLAAVFRDVVYKQTGKFPLLNLFGPPGSGKSEMAVSLMHMLGFNNSAISLEGESTGKSYMRKVAQVRNGLVWLDEYKNSMQKHIGNLKNMYDGTGYDRAKMTNDNQTKQTPVNSSIILSGQDMPTSEPALFTRVVLVSFEEGKFTQADRDHFHQLKKVHEAGGLSYITAGMMKHRKLVEEEFPARQPIIFRELVQELNNTEMVDRMVLNISLLLTMYDVLKTVIKFPFSYREAKEVLTESAKHQHAILQGADNAARFWGIVELLFHQSLIFEGKDFELEDGYLFISIISVHPLYIKEMHAQRDPNFLAKSTLEYYLKLDKTKYVDYTRRRFASGSNTYCYKMKYASLGIDLIGLTREEQLNLNASARADRIKAKYAMMGMADAVQTSSGEQVDDDMPFPEFKP